MLTEFLAEAGFHDQAGPINYSSVLPVFSVWIKQQDVSQDDRFYLASRVGAFICQYLIDTSNARWHIKGEQLLICVPIEDGVERELNPYPLALCVVDKQLTLQDVIQSIS